MDVFLIIEDNPADYFILNEELKGLGLTTDTSEHITSLEELKNGTVTINPTFVFCDLDIDDSVGLATFKAVQQYYPNIPIVIISSTENREVVFEAMQLGADDYLKKSQYDRMLLEKTVRFAQERRRYRKQMEVMELRYKSVVENSLVSFLLTEPDGEIIEANRAAVDMFGYTVDEMKTLGTHSIIDYTDPRVDNLISTRTKHGKVMGEIIGIRKNKEPFPCEFASSVFTDINGHDKISTVFIDISERRKFELEKNFEQRDKEALINSVGDLIWSVDTDMKLIAGNDAFKQSLKGACGVDFKQGDYLLGTEYFPEEFINHWKALYKKALLGKPFKEEIYVSKLKVTEANWSEISFNPIYNDDKITGIACYARNITERKENEIELKQLHTQLQKRLSEIAESNNELRKIAWTQSHMVRAPLARVMGFVDLLAEDCKKEDMCKFLGYIKDAATELDDVIRDIVKKAEKANTVLPHTDEPPQYL